MNINGGIDNFLAVLKSIPVNSEDEQTILGGLVNADGEKPKILVVGGQTGDPMSLIPVDVPLFGEVDAPRFPVEVVSGESLAIKLKKGNTVHEFVRAEDFRTAEREGAESCIVVSSSELLQSVDLRFCFLDPDPAREYGSSLFAKLTDGCSGCIFVLGAGDGALLNHIGEFCTWIANTGVLSGNIAVILNHAEYDSPNPFLAAMLKKSLRAEEVVSIVATTFREYADEDPGIYFAGEALRSAVETVASREPGSHVDEIIKKCRKSVSEKIGRENQRLFSELDELQSGMRIRSRIIESFPPFATTMLPSAGVILTDGMKLNIYGDLHRFLQKLHDSIPALVRECAECSPDTYKFDLMCFSSDYLSDVINSGVKDLTNDIINAFSKALEQKFGDIRSEFLVYIQDAPEFSATAGSKTDFLNCVNVMAGSYIPASVNVIAGLPGFLAKMLANRFYYGLGDLAKILVDKLLTDVMIVTTIKMMPRKAFLNNLEKGLQAQLLKSMNQLSGLLDQYIYPRLSGYIEDARDGLIKDYCGTITLEKEELEQKAGTLRERLAELETGLRRLNGNERGKGI